MAQYGVWGGVAGWLLGPAFFAALLAVVLSSLASDTAHASHFWAYDVRKNWEDVVMAVAGLVLDLNIIHHHYKVKPHPKFLLSPWRRFWIVCHVVGGSLELFCLIAAFFSANPAPLATAGALAALALHVPSATTMIPIVFGQKLFMVPAYAYMIAVHATMAARLAMDPTSLLHLFSTYMMLQMYAWVRLTYVTVKKMKAFVGYEYTVAVLVGSYVGMPPTFGHAWRVILVLVPAGLYFAQPVLLRLGITLFATVGEANRESVSISRTKEVAAVRELSAAIGYGQGNKASDRDRARTVFRFFDRDNSGSLDQEEIVGIMEDLGWNKAKRQSFTGDQPSRSLSFEDFYTNIWCHGKARIAGNRLSEASRAQIVFKAMDADDSGFVEVQEMEELLVAWGLPREEARSIFAAGDKDRNGKLDLQEFTAEFKEVYDYGIDLLMSGYVDRKEIRDTNALITGWST